MRKPRVPAPAREPMARCLLYPRFDSSSRVILPTVAVVAALDPETAANREQAKTLICRSRPGILDSQGSRPLSSLVEMAVR